MKPEPHHRHRDEMRRSVADRRLADGLITAREWVALRQIAPAKCRDATTALLREIRREAARRG